MTGVWIESQKVKGHLCCPDNIKGGKQMEERMNQIATERDESGAATCEVKNKLCVIIRSKGTLLASHPGQDQSVFRTRCGKMPLHDDANVGIASRFVGIDGAIRLVMGIRVGKYGRADVE
jgi:hypothetical protein